MDTNQQTTTHQPNRPALTHRDKDLKCTVWCNQGEKGEYFTTTLAKTYTDDQGYARDTNNLSQTDLLRGAELMRETYGMINELRRERAQNRNMEQENAQSTAQNQAQDSIQSPTQDPIQAQNPIQGSIQAHAQGDPMSGNVGGPPNPEVSEVPVTTEAPEAPVTTEAAGASETQSKEAFKQERRQQNGHDLQKDISL